MIKKERGVLTYMSEEINGMLRNSYASGRNFAQTTDDKLEKALSKARNHSDDLER